MSSGSLILPYAVEDVDREKPFEYNMEVAAALCLAEAKRRKGGILGGSAERISFVSRLYYPLWAVPWEDESLIMDGLGFLSHTVVHMKLPDVEAFTEGIQKSTMARDLYRDALKRHVKTFREFISSDEIPMDTVIANENLLLEVFDYVNQGLALKKNVVGPFVLIPPRLNEKAALKRAGKLVGQWREIQSEIKGLHYAINLLSEKTDFHERKILLEVEQVQGKYEREILSLRPAVEKRVDELTMERDSKVEKVLKAAEKEANAALKKRQRLERELQKLELRKDEYQQRRKARKHKGDRRGVSRWNLKIRMCQKKISNVKWQIKDFSRLVDRVRRQCESDVERLEESCQEAISQEEKRILDLEALRDSEVAEKQEEIEELRSKTSSIIRQIEQLMEQKVSHASELEELTVPWKPKGATLICLPFYLVRYEAEAKSRYDVHPPTVAEDYNGIIKRIQKAILSFSLESRINLLLRPRSKAMKEMLASIFTKSMRKDEAFEKLMCAMGSSNNLLRASGFVETLTKGMEELAREGWISPEEKDLVIKTYALPSANSSKRL